MDPDALTARLDAAVAAGVSLQPALAEIDQLVFDGAEFPEELFDHLLRLMASPLLLDHRDAVSLMKLFEDQAELLLDDQRGRLAAALPRFVAVVRDDLAAFLAVEIVGTVAASERAALESLVQLQGGLAPRRLTVLVHGYDWLCKQATDSKVRDACLAHLKGLQRHGDPAVSAEASAALTRRSRAPR